MSVILKHVDRILKHVVMKVKGRKREVEATKETMSPADIDELHIFSLTGMFVLYPVRGPGRVCVELDRVTEKCVLLAHGGRVPMLNPLTPNDL
jgi:hypothetical protein